MTIEDLHNWEKAVVILLNFDGWDLTWTGENMNHCDAVGTTPKGYTCALEIKFRKTWYETKMLEQYKYDRLMEMDQSVKLYFVNDPKGNYMFWLDDLKLSKPQEMWCPSTTVWNSNKIKKPCYLLSEDQAAWTTIY